MRIILAIGKGINGEGGFKRGRWETLVIQFGETYTRSG